MIEPWSLNNRLSKILRWETQNTPAFTSLSSLPDSCSFHWPHLWQELSNGRCEGRTPNKGDHAIAIHSAVHLPIHGQNGEHPGGTAGLADVAVATLSMSVWYKQRVSSAVIVFKGAVLIIGKVILRANILCSTSEAKKARPTVASWREKGATNAQ